MPDTFEQTQEFPPGTEEEVLIREKALLEDIVVSVTYTGSRDNGWIMTIVRER